MQKFYFNEKIKITALIGQLNAATEKFSAKDYHADTLLMQLLSDAINTYRDLGYSERESQLQVLRAEFVTAQRGVNPISFEKQSIRRHEMTNTISFKILQAIEGLLRSDLEEKNARLQQASDLVAQIIIASMQAGILKNDEIKKIKNQQDLESIWSAIGADANIDLGQKRVLLLINKYDALILFDDLLAPFKT